MESLFGKLQHERPNTSFLLPEHRRQMSSDISLPSSIINLPSLLCFSAFVRRRRVFCSVPSLRMSPCSREAPRSTVHAAEIRNTLILCDRSRQMLCVAPVTTIWKSIFKCLPKTRAACSSHTQGVLSVAPGERGETENGKMQNLCSVC